MLGNYDLTITSIRIFDTLNSEPVEFILGLTYKTSLYRITHLFAWASCFSKFSSLIFSSDSTSAFTVLSSQQENKHSKQGGGSGTFFTGSRPD